MRSLTFALSLIFMASASPAQERSVSIGTSTMRVLTYNIHHGEGTDRVFDLARLADIIKSTAPDLVALQEVDEGTKRSGGVQQLSELARLTGLYPTFGKAIDFQGGEYGVAILSRWPVLSIRNQALPGVEDREARTALTVTVQPAANAPIIAFTNTHFDSSREVEGRNTQAAALMELLTEGEDALSILAGDLNSRVDSEALRILSEVWTDVSEPDIPQLDASGRLRGRVDYIFVKHPAHWRVIESQMIDAPVASDHRPVLVVLEMLAPAHRPTLAR